MDSRVSAVAQARSEDMADRDYFAHQDPDGKWPWDHLSDAGITWHSAGEIIAWNMQSPVESSAAGAVAQWMASTMGHREEILGTVHNYAGVGVAIDGSTHHLDGGVHPGPRSHEAIGAADQGLERYWQQVDLAGLVRLRSAAGDTDRGRALV